MNEDNNARNHLRRRPGHILRAGRKPTSRLVVSQSKSVSRNQLPVHGRVRPQLAAGRGLLVVLLLAVMLGVLLGRLMRMVRGMQAMGMRTVDPRFREAWSVSRADSFHATM